MAAHGSGDYTGGMESPCEHHQPQLHSTKSTLLVAGDGLVFWRQRTWSTGGGGCDCNFDYSGDDEDAGGDAVGIDGAAAAACGAARRRDPPIRGCD